MEMRKHKTLIAALFLFLIIITNYKIKLTITEEPAYLDLPVLTSMIMNDETDEDVIKKINLNPSLMNEIFESPFISMQTPLLTAITYNRLKIAEHMIVKGVSFKDSQKILKEGNYAEYLDVLNTLIGQINKKSKKLVKEDTTQFQKP